MRRFIVAQTRLPGEARPKFFLNKCLFRPLAYQLSIAICLLISSFVSNAQSDIPIGTWRMHPSFNSINSLTLAGQKVYGAAQSGIMILDQSDNSLSTYSKLNGLSGTNIRFINYHQPTQLLLIAYENGNFDVIDSDNEITSFDPTETSSYTGSKKINHIFFYESLAYLSTDYGVVVFDLTRLQVKETWRDLGAGGETLEILSATFGIDSIFLATEHGVLAGSLNNNLLDFNVWKRFENGEFNGPVQTVSTFNGTVFSAINYSGIHRYVNGSWTKESFLQGLKFESINASDDNLLIAETDKLWRLSKQDILSPVITESITSPRFAVEDAAGKLWIGDGKNGLVSDASGSFINYLPNGPSNDSVFNLKFHAETIYALSGGYSSTRAALNNPGNQDQFNNGSWTTKQSVLFDLTDMEFGDVSDNVYTSSFGFGVEERNDGISKVFDETNSPLINTNPPARFVNITSLINSSDGLWVANYGAMESLHLLKNDNTWDSYSFPVVAARYPLRVIADFYGSIWMVLDPSQGGGILVFNKNENSTTYLTDATGQGGLPSRSVHSITLDRDGLVWVGTDMGVAFFIDPSQIFSTGVDAIKPILEGRFLLRDEKVTALAVDGGNRKWIGTERGVWLFSTTGEELVYNFNTENSPLPSDILHDIEINDLTGEVFFATAGGIVSFRSDATQGNNSFQSVKVFPNPITANFVGTVGIDGLATDAIVKITDITGKLIWQTRANGGTASWNALDNLGRRIPTGVYVVFAVTEDGAEHAVAKIAVVE